MHNLAKCIKFIYSEKATKFCEIFPLLTFECMYCSKSKVEILKIFVAFSEYMNFTLLKLGQKYLAIWKNFSICDKLFSVESAQLEEKPPYASIDHENHVDKF